MITILPPEVVNQIAAGEVVERPFSVVKELVENSLDAGARRIDVELEDGGRAAIRVVDDGEGFGAEDLALAFHSHATSKLRELADLDHIASLGFRGEALASIGSIARARIRSRRPGADVGHEIESEGGALGEVRPCGCPAGSVVEVRDLFFNTPARRRFLKSARAERARIHELLIRLGLARTDVAFSLTDDARQIVRLPAGETLRERVGRTFGERIAAHLLDVELGWGDHRVVGLAGDPDIARRDASHELLFVNGRAARDRAAVHALRQAWRPYLVGARFPVYFLMLTLPPDQVDVNVHPTKSEVRFLEGRRVCGLLHDAVARTLAARGALAQGAGGLSVGEELPRASSGFPRLPADLFARSPAAANAPRGAEPARTADAEPLPQHAGRIAARPHPFASAPRARFLQVLDLYVVFEGESGLVVVDQHALHERILYERFMRAARARGKIAVQRLLVPEVVDLSPGDKAWLLDAADVLAEHGLEVADFGAGSVAIHGVPALLDRADPRRVLAAFLAGDGDGDARPRARDAIVERFHSMACRGAVMRGDRLTEAEMRALLVEAATLEHPHNCPHGRPTVLRFDAGELERFFRRRV